MEQWDGGPVEGLEGTLYAIEQEGWIQKSGCWGEQGM
jgi:hypothetical protein